MAKIQQVGDKIYFKWGYHELAWSIRTSGMPLIALFRDGKTKLIGRTQKKPGAIPLPPDTIAVVWKYKTNAGYTVLTVYPTMGTEFEVEERFNWRIPGYAYKNKEVVDALLKAFPRLALHNDP